MKIPTTIALGSHVTYTHRAAVARRQKNYDGNHRLWELTEPKAATYHTQHRGEVLTIMTSVTPITFVDAEEIPERPEKRYPVAEERWEKRNKSIFRWADEGSGVVVGLVRKQYGISVGSSGRQEDWDQGYFEAFGQISLYVVKSELRGPEVYVPESAIHLVHA